MTGTAFDFRCRIEGTEGEALATNLVQPHADDRVIVRTGASARTEHLGTRSSYTYQLEAVAALVREGRPVATDADDAVRTMDLMDAAYAAAGFPSRPATISDRPA